MSVGLEVTGHVVWHCHSHIFQCRFFSIMIENYIKWGNYATHGSVELMSNFFFRFFSYFSAGLRIDGLLNMTPTDSTPVQSLQSSEASQLKRPEEEALPVCILSTFVAEHYSIVLIYTNLSTHFAISFHYSGQ